MRRPWNPDKYPFQRNIVANFRQALRPLESSMLPDSKVWEVYDELEDVGETGEERDKAVLDDLRHIIIGTRS